MQIEKIIKNDCYNIYYPLKHEPEQGEWNNINALFQHIFGEQYEIGLDYIQLMYQQPLQVLPILCLVSKENETGKTTFFEFLNMIFGENVVNVGNSEITSDFNTFVTGRLFVGVNETALEDNAKITEKIKMLSDSTKASMTGKGVDTVSIDNFTKYGFTSNNETRFIRVSQTEQRFWIRKVPILSEAQKQNVDFRKYLYEEIPAFLFFLNSRKIKHERKSRMWFDPEILITEALERLRAQQRPSAQKIIEDYIHDTMIDCVRPVLYYTIKNLLEHCSGLLRYEAQIEYVIRENLQLEKYRNDKGKECSKYYNIYSFKKVYNGMEEKFELTKTNERGRPFVFPAEKFLSLEEIESNFPHKNEKEESKPEDPDTNLPF